MGSYDTTPRSDVICKQTRLELNERNAILTNNHGKEIKYIVCARPSSLKKRYTGAEYEKAIARKHIKSSIRCKVEHVFAVVKGMFRFRKLDCEA